MNFYKVIIDGDEFKPKDFFPTVVSLKNEFEVKFRWMLDQGISIPEHDWDPIPEFISVQDGKPDTKLANDIRWLIFSDEALESFHRHGISEIQILPVKVYGGKGELLEEYNHVVNLTRLISCLDLERSQYVLFDETRPDRQGDILALFNAVLGDKMPDYDFFRVSEYPQLIVASERFVKLYRKMKFTGLAFKKLEKS